MNYEINVALDGHHLFATANRSITDEWKLRKTLKILVDKFPESEGYHISVTRLETCGYPINIDEILKEEN